MKDFLTIAAACLLGLLATTGASLPYPILPPLFATAAADNLNHFMGLPPKLLLGLALTVNPLGLLIGTAVLGPVSDRFGRRPVLLATSLAGAVGHAVTGLALAIHSYPLFLLARFVTGILEGNSSVVRAMLADRLRGTTRNRALSWFNGALHLGWLVGPLVAGLTVGWGVTVPFGIAAAALGLGAIAAALTLAPEADTGAAGSWWTVARDNHALNLLRHGELRAVFATYLAYTCGVTAFYAFYPLWLVEVAGYDARGIALMNVGMCGVMTLSSMFAGGPSRHEPVRRASLFAFCVAAAVGSLSFGNLWVGMAGILLFGLPNAFFNAVMQGWAAERFGAHGQGAVMGLLGTTFCLGHILMTTAGSVLTLVDTRLILVLGAVLSATAGLRMRAWRWHLAPSAALAEAK